MPNRTLALNKYSTNINHYHTIHHVNSMINNLGKHLSEFLQEFPELDLNALIDAIVYHDVVYVPGRQDNEKKSAEFYEFENGRKDVVISAILSTVPTEYKYPNPLSKVLHDLDWYDFSNFELMVKNGQKIWCEASDHLGVSYNDCIKGQIKFYQYLLDRNLDEKPIFVTKSLSYYNEITKINIQNYIKYAEGLIK